MVTKRRNIYLFDLVCILLDYLPSLAWFSVSVGGAVFLCHAGVSLSRADNYQIELAEYKMQVNTLLHEVKKVSDDLEETAKTSPITPRDRQKILNATKQSDRILEQVVEETEKLINLSA